MKIWFEDNDEWSSWKKREDPVLHIELRKVSKALVIAPLSANSMAKIVNGLCDNLLTNVFRAWDFNAKSCVLVPVMSKYMQQGPITNTHL